MGFSLEVSVPAITVFLQGIFSFFSPCVLPILPLYIGYLSGGTAMQGEDGRIYYKRSKVMVHTVCFVVGVSFAFFLLGLGVNAVGSFFRSNQVMFARLGGIVVVLFGLYQLGIFGQSGVLGKERRLPFHLDQAAMSPWTAFVMGFTFSFAWTPCVGPALASVLLMAASASTRATGFVLIGVYTLGFILPFLAAGFFTTTLLEMFQKHMGVVRYTVKIGGALLVVLGLLMFTGKMNGITGYLSQFTPSGIQSETEPGSNGTADGKTDGDEGGDQQAGSGAAPKAKDRDQAGESTGTGEKDGQGASVPESQKGTADEGATDAGTENGDQESDHESGSEDPGKTDQDSGENKIPAPGFELEDQFGNVHRLEDYKGKTVFLNFWATWCPPCKAEMPDIQKLYEESATEGDEALIVLGVAGPNMGNESSQSGIEAFLEANGYTYPVLMDTDGGLFQEYGIYSFPTTFMIDRIGNVFGYSSAMLTYDMMKDIVAQTMEGKRRQ